MQPHAKAFYVCMCCVQPHMQTALYDPMFILVSTLGAFIGFGISFFSLWFLSQTTATLYSLVGALNKIPVRVL